MFGLGRIQMMLIGGGLAIVIAAAGIAWLRWDAVKDERAKQEAAANKARLEHIEGARSVEREIENLGSDGFNDAIDGLPRRNPEPTTVQ